MPPQPPPLPVAQKPPVTIRFRYSTVALLLLAFSQAVAILTLGMLYRTELKVGWMASENRALRAQLDQVTVRALNSTERLRVVYEDSLYMVLRNIELSDQSVGLMAAKLRLGEHTGIGGGE